MSHLSGLCKSSLEQRASGRDDGPQPVPARVVGRGLGTDPLFGSTTDVFGLGGAAPLALPGSGNSRDGGERFQLVWEGARPPRATHEIRRP